ncbi:type III-B CRISPR module RAMP protein Cmr4 [Dehalobacterium formicoaceticum]|uniref:Type III-B CRISPR module RAMP protein Cmr4 n=1 Tax=Dehalobacterium formicoaceticum TaxID=51515 RepID=A0ABT1Y2D4_9FIRM|nr:type III-B CRISPR module RAMP protein Cmr4 [Dehalobacterium formicoaceticum]MCR6544718.1 type III-B CRISPR module RAMP protein Cmr4 [Dehalobacterium formicoaceticum]
MYKLAKPFFLICETPLHAGSGSDLGIIDMPIQRERHTGFPKIEGSSLKGSIRERFERCKDLYDIQFRGGKLSAQEIGQCVNLLFGPEKGGDFAAALGITDARVLLFPVKSVKGVYAWITCPQVLEKFINELGLCGVNVSFEVPGDKATPHGSNLFVRDDKVILEEYTFKVNHKEDEQCTALTQWLSEILLPDVKEFKTLKEKIRKDIIVLSNDEFRDFVQWSTEVITRTKINNETGTVADGALFTEEFLPAETVLYALAMAAPVFNPEKSVLSDGEGAVMEFFQTYLPQILQIGGDATIGKGITRVEKRLLGVEG